MLREQRVGGKIATKERRGVLEKGPERSSNRISKAQLMYTISGDEIPGKKRGKARARGRFPATEIDHITFRLIKFKRC